MESLVSMLPWLLGGLVLVVAMAALQKPLRGLVRLLARTGVGLAVLWLFGRVGGLIGVTLGVNLFNALVLGVLGAPGFGLLLMGPAVGTHFAGFLTKRAGVHRFVKLM